MILVMVLEVLTLIVAGVTALGVGLTAWLNHNAHKGITTRIGDVDQRAEDVDQRSVQRDEAHRQALESIARDVSFMAGRQAERDRQG